MPLLLAHARFEEAHGEHAAAAELCAKAAALRPASLEAALAHVQQARRAGELPRARAAYAAGVAALDGEPLFCSSVPVSEDGDQLVCAGPMEEEAGWCSSVEFVVDAGARPIQGSTIYDLTEDVPVLVRERLGPAIPELDLAVA